MALPSDPMSGDNGARPIGVLGLGSIGLRHARNLLDLGREVIGYDPDPARQATVAALGGEIAPNRDALLKQSAAVVVCSPNAHHRDDLGDAIAAGCSVLIEKPLAHTDIGLEELLDQAERQGLVIFAGFNLRFHPAVRLAAQWLAEKRLGTPLWARAIFSDFLPHWRPSQDYRLGYTADPRTGGVIFDVIHEIDLVTALLGPGHMTAASARNTGTLGITSEDCADLIIRHSCGVQSSVHLDYVTRPRRRVTEIAGTNGMFILDLDARRLSHIGTDGGVVAEVVFPGSASDDYREEMRAFMACLVDMESPACDGRQALAVLRLALDARRLAKLPPTRK